MKILLLGGTGLIGGAIAENLVGAGAQVAILCRSDNSVANAESLRASPVRGDIAQPQQWISSLDGFDAVIHCACTFDDDMPELDRQLLDAVFERMRGANSRKTLIYTGGTWLYPDSAGKPMDESTPYDAVARFEWMVDGINRVQNNPDIRGLIVHPAIGVDDPDGIPDFLAQDFAGTGELNIPFDNQLRWPIVHRKELAEAYFCVLENGAEGETYNAASIEAASVATLVTTLRERHNVTAEPQVRPMEYWVERYGELGGYPRSQNLSSAKLRALGWSPSLLTAGDSDLNPR